ncbi:MAG: GNAT family N-acetyltransferase [Clostridia bacterium]|nr:GNAT family N-acetyltransferase [Clostridia bacterium]
MKCETVYKVFSAIPQLETERLLLRKMMVGDCYDMYEYASNPEVTRYLTWHPHPDLEYTKDYLKYIANHYRLGDFYDWAVILKEENKMIGTCGFTRFRFPHNAAEIGYVINPAYRGREIAGEAVRAVMKFGFETLELHRIEAKYMAGNVASRRVMEKVGMSFEGVRRGEMMIKGEYRDVGTCAILREEARARGVF